MIVKSRLYRRRPLEERFWERVDVRGPDECWPWLGCTDKDGYGMINSGADADSKTLKSHRVAWILKNGDVPSGMEVCHSCDSPPCCNESHLFCAPHLINIADMVAKGRARSCSRPGENHPNARLSAAQVAGIRSATGLQREIAERFGTTQSYVSAIRRGEKRVIESPMPR